MTTMAEARPKLLKRYTGELVVQRGISVSCRCQIDPDEMFAYGKIKRDRTSMLIGYPERHLTV